MHNRTTENDASNSDFRDSATLLSGAYMEKYPYSAARKIECMDVEEAVSVISNQPAHIINQLANHITLPQLATIAALMPTQLTANMLSHLDSSKSASLLSRLDSDVVERVLTAMPSYIASELRELMEYPANSAGRIMETRALSFHASSLISDIMMQLKNHPAIVRRKVYCVDSDLKLIGEMSLEKLVVSDQQRTLGSVCEPISHFVFALDPNEVVATTLQLNGGTILPVVDIEHRLLGIIRGTNAQDALREDIVADIQTMVGASRDEKALSSSLFAVRKRQMWLQINLLTGFIAAAVVGLFESTIAQFTALAILMPVAAGQSGNTGAQALAVTMRGLTLREITTRHWLKVASKEAIAGFVNGVAIAITCSIGVYIWSKNTGLAIVIALAMVISMTIAGASGALVPIVLRKLGQDPAQSSSIVLTTITDIAGFMSFLGIATALAFLIELY